MKRHLLFLSLLVAVLPGCATIQPPPAAVAQTPLRMVTAHGISVKQAEFQQVDGRLRLFGWAKKALAWTPSYGIHIDVRFAGQNGEPLALRTANVSFRPARHSNPPAAFSAAIAEWPAGTVSVICEPHRGAHDPAQPMR